MGRLSHGGRGRSRETTRRYVRFCLFTTLLAVCFLGGGASRVDVLSLLYVQPAAPVIGMAALLLTPRFEWGTVRVAACFLAALALLMIVQLIPLPASWWLGLPGHGPFAEAANAVGIAQPARPLSLAPDSTLGSLVGLVTPLGVLVCYGCLDPVQRRLAPRLLIVGLCASAVLGIAQLATGASSAFYLYRITNADSAVGFFANRNHQAILLDLSFPLLAWWLSQSPRSEGHRTAKLWIAGALAAFVPPMVLVTGSRAGLVGAVLSGGLTAILYRAELKRFLRRSRYGRFAGWAAVGGVSLLVVGAVLLSRAQAWERLFVSGDSPNADLRWTNLPIYAAMIRDFFPFGTGFGTFERVFGAYEATDTMVLAYVNHAHNDLLEWLIEGGLGSAAILAVYLTWFLRTAVKQPENSDILHQTFKRLGAGIIIILLFSSLFDYPLRTPLFAAIFALATAFLADPAEMRRAAGNSRPTSAFTDRQGRDKAGSDQPIPSTGIS